MHTLFTKRPFMMASLVAASMVSAQTDDPTEPLVINLDPSEDATEPLGVKLRPPDEVPRNRFGLNYRMALNVCVDFKRLGGFRRQTDPGMTLGGGVDRYYDNGYNLVDSSGSADGLTWNWGYDGASPLAGGSEDTLNLFSSTSPNTARKNGVDDGPQHGFELTYDRDMGELGKGRWGLQGALGYMHISVEDNSELVAPVHQLVDSYAPGDVIPPFSPYEGSFSGPGPLISDSPVRVNTVTPKAADVTGSRQFEADFFGARVGPYYTFPLSEKINLRGDIGLALAAMKSTVSFNETVTIEGVGSQRSKASSTDTAILVGGYAGAGLDYAINESWDIFAGAQYQYMGQYSEQAGGKKAVTDFGAMIMVSLGVGYSF